MNLKALLFSLCAALFVLPASAQDFAVDQLEASPRHHEWVTVSTPDGRDVHSFVAYPEREDPTPAVIVIHENRGLTDWVRSAADQVAAAGYLAIAPDLLSGFDAEHERTSDFESSDAARSAIYDLNAEQVLNDLQAVKEHVAQMPASNGTVAVMGFCWGGSQTFRFATHASDLSSALVFYGTAPEDEARIRQISAPVYGFYGEKDERVNSTIPRTEKLMQKHGKTYEYEIYDGAGHAFMRRGDNPEGSPAHQQARDQAWKRVKKILSDLE